MPLTAKQMLFLKKSLPFFEFLPTTLQKRLLTSATSNFYRKSAVIYGGGRHCTGLMLVVNGQLRTYLSSDKGRELTLYRLLERDLCIFSAACMMKNITFDIWIQAEKDTQVITFPPELALELEQVHPSAQYLYQLLSSRFSDVVWVMEQTLFMSFDKRLAIFLLEQEALEGSWELHLTHEAIAKNLGSAREVVTRMLQYFQSEGLVSLSRGGITLKNHAKLKALASRPS